MLQLELLPRLIPDSYFGSLEDAMSEVEKRKSSQMSADALTRISESRYGGFRVFTVSRSVVLDYLVGQAEYDLLDPTVFPKVFQK